MEMQEIVYSVVFRGNCVGNAAEPIGACIDSSQLFLAISEKGYTAVCKSMKTCRSPLKMKVIVSWNTSTQVNSRNQIDRPLSSDM